MASGKQRQWFLALKSLLTMTENDMWNADSPPRTSSLTMIMCIALFSRALLPFIAYSWTHDARIFKLPDTASYLACAESLVRTGSFSIGGIPEIVRTPGYPLLLVPGVLLRHVTSVTVLLQMFLGCVTVWLVYGATLALTGNRTAATTAGLLGAVEPLSVLYCSLLLAETLFATAIMLFLFLFVCHLKTGKISYLVTAACALVATIYVRPIAYWLPFAMAVVLAAAHRRQGKRGRSVLLAFVFLCICAVSIGLWQVRNYRATGYRGFSGIGEQTLCFYDAAAVEAAVRGEPYYAVQQRMRYHNGMVDVSGAEGLEHIAVKARRIIFAHPGVFAILYAKGIVRTLFDPAAVDYLKFLGCYQEGSGLLGKIVDRGLADAMCELARTRPALFWGNLGLGLVLSVYLVGALLPFVRSRERGVPLGAVAIVALYLIILSGGPNALGRFRHPVMPLVCVLAGCGFARIWRKRTTGAAHADSTYHGGHDDGAPRS